VRGLVFGPEAQFLRYLGMHTAAYVFRDRELHAQARGRFTLTETLDRQLGCYGLDEDRVAVFTVHRTDDPARPADPRAELRSQFAGMGDPVDQVLRHCPPPEEI